MTDPLFLNAAQARALLGFGRDKFRRLVKAGIVPSWVDPDTGTRYFSRLVLEDWARGNGTWTPGRTEAA